MHSDRYRNVVLTVIAIGLWALTMTQLETTEVMAASGFPSETVIEADSQSASRGPTVSAEPRGEATSTKPLRWRAMNAYHDVDSAHSICGTVVTVRNVAPTSVAVDVEWFDLDGVSKGLSTLSVSSEESQVIWTNANVELHPILANGTSTDTADFAGWANVHADDPRILASTTIVCRDSAGAAANIEALLDIPTYPVGATAEYFQAGMPAAWTPPMAVPEVPE